MDAAPVRSEVDSFAGKIHVFWDPNAQVTALGPVTFFIEFLKTSGLWKKWVENCPLQFMSRNSPKKGEILATVLLSVLAGQKRYARSTALRTDGVFPKLLNVDCLRTEDMEGKVRLQGWTREQRILVFRRKLREKLVLEERVSGQIWPSGVELGKGKELFEYAVLGTTLNSKDLLMLSQLCRDRAEAKNVFDELKNQWGWTGFMTRDRKRSQAMSRIVALIFNWWSLYSRLALPDNHAQATTSRQLFLHGVARRTGHRGQTKLTSVVLQR